VKLFQIEEPEGGPSDPEAPGAAISIDASGAAAEVAMAVGGNAVILADRDGFERALPVPAPGAASAQWQELFEGARLRAERALARPVTHALVVVVAPPEPAHRAAMLAAAEAAGLEVLRLTCARDLDANAVPALVAAILAEDMAPRPHPERG
jgi:hypothetical protein